MTSRIDRVNRFLVAFLGLLVLAAGVVGLCLSYGAFGDATSRKVLLTESTRDYVHRNGGWLWPVAAVVCGVLALLGLWWLLKQSSTSGLRRYRLAGAQREDSITVRGSALVDAVCSEIEDFHGVRSAQGSLAGHPREPVLRLTVDLEDQASVGAVRTRIENTSLVHARQASGVDHLPVTLRLHVTSKPGARVA